MASEHSPTSTATPDDMASYAHTTDTSTHTSPHRAADCEEEWYDSKTPELHQQHFQYNQADSPDLELNLHDFSHSHSFSEHAAAVRKSLVLSDSMASVALKDIRGSTTEHQTQLAMTNSPSFSALASILERKEAKFKNTAVIVEEEEQSPNLIQFDDDTPRPRPEAPFSTFRSQDNDIFKTPDVPQSQRFPHQEYSSMLTTVESSPAQVTQRQSTHSADSEEEEEEHIQSAPLPLPKSPAKTHTSPLMSQHYSQRSASMPVVVTKKDTKEKRRSFMSFFKPKRSISSSTVPKKSSSFSIPSSSSSPSASSPQVMQLKGSKSFSMPKQTQPEPMPRPQAQRSASSTSLFSAFKRKKAQQPIISIQQPEEEDKDDAFSVSSDDFNEDFNNLNSKPYDHDLKEEEEPYLSTSPLPTPTSSLPLPVPSSPLLNKRLSQISQGSRRYSQISQGETIFPKNLSAQEVESIVSLERNRSISRQSLNSRRQSMVSVTNNKNYIEQSIPHKPSFESMSVTSIQLSPGRLNTNASSPEYKRRDYLSFDDDEDEQKEEHDELFNVEEFSHRLEFDTIADNYTPEPEDVDMSSQFAEFADYIDFGDGLELDLGFDDPMDSPLSQPVLFNSPQVDESEEEEEHNFMPSPQLSQKQAQSPSPLSSPFLQQSAYVPSLQRPVSMSFRGLKAPAFNTMHDSDSMDSFLSSQQSMSSFKSTTPSISSQPKKTGRRVMFSSKIVVFDVNAADEYDRTPDIATCNQLTPQLAVKIRAEVNELKSQMEIHEDSRCYIHFL